MAIRLSSGMHLGSVALVLFLSMGPSLTSCGPGLYELPDPPPQEEWRRHTLSPAENDVLSREHFLAAKDSILSFVEAMQAGEVARAYGCLSNETRILLDDLSADGLGETVLREGRIVRDDAEYVIDPIDLFVVRDLSDVLDTYEDRMESETYRRKEVYAISADGTVHHVVLIFEEDQWHIHKPDIELTPGAPGRRTGEP